MLSRMEKIRLLIGMIIVAFIFFIIGFSTYLEKSNEFDSLINYETKFSDSIPDEYSNEVINVNELKVHSLKIDKSEKVVGFSMDLEADKCFEIIKTMLASKGWTYVESGSSSSASFYKESGTYSWVFVNCIFIGGETSVVLTVD